MLEMVIGALVFFLGVVTGSAIVRSEREAFRKEVHTDDTVPQEASGNRGA